MNIPGFVVSDIGKIITILQGDILHYGIFGSLLSNGIEDAHDIDVLFVYKNIEYEEICRKVKSISLNFPIVTSYCNYTKKFGKPPEEGKYYDFIFMPKEKPNREFMTINDGKIFYLSSEFESWRKMNSVEV